MINKTTISPHKIISSLISINLVFLICLFYFSEASSANLIQPSGFDNVKDFTYMWWRDGLENEPVFCISTSYYSLAVGCRNSGLSIEDFHPNLYEVSEAEALVMSNANVFPGASQQHLFECVLEADDKRYKMVGLKNELRSAQIIASGKFFQQRWIRDLTYESGAPELDEENTGIEISAWPDRISFIHNVKTKAQITNGAIELSIGLPVIYSKFYDLELSKAGFSEEGRGFIFVPYPKEASIYVDEINRIFKVRYEIGKWDANEEKAVGLIIYPTKSHIESKLVEAIENESGMLSVNAKQTLPVAKNLFADYDERYGWYKISGNVDSDIDGMTKISLAVSNHNNVPKVFRMNFYRDDYMDIVGISPMLRDINGDPIGIPVQISKNWHFDADRFQGPWYMGLSMMTIPAKTTVDFEYVRVNSYWGQNPIDNTRIPAVSHAQLCLVGYADCGHTVWDEAAIGSWGEHICFDPDVGLERSMIDDVRPLFVTTMDGGTYGWTANVGGGDFLVYYDNYNQKQSNSRMRTRYQRYGPNITEVIYAGRSKDSKIEIKCTTKLFRTDDLVRIYYHLRYDVKKDVNFSRLAFFQLGADTYNDHSFEKMAVGDIDGLIKEWTPVKGGEQYSIKSEKCSRQRPWFSLHEGNKAWHAMQGAWANRGLIITSWDARLGGENIPDPYYSVYGTDDDFESANVEISPPPFEAGSNLIPNGDFEKGFLGWPHHPGCTIVPVPGRGNVLNVNAVGQSSERGAVSDVVRVEPNTAYKLSSKVRQLQGTGSYEVSYEVTLDWMDESGTHISYANGGTGSNVSVNFTGHGGVFTSPNNAASLIIHLLVAAGVEAQFDDIEVYRNVDRLQAGDYLEVELLQLIIPQFKDDYHGTNDQIVAALVQYENSWEMVYREAVENNVLVNVTKGELIHHYPTQIKVGNNDTATFAISGGLGYIPITISGLSNYQSPALYWFFEGRWQLIDQGYYGNDFWQADYDAETKTWDISFNVPVENNPSTHLNFIFWRESLNIDTDGDGIQDNNDAFPIDPNEWLDTDGDGIGNKGDLDDDDDGMPDDWENQHSLNPFVDDASGDADNDGFTNYKEYRAGTDPNDPNLHPSKAMPWIPLLLLDE